MSKSRRATFITWLSLSRFNNKGYRGNLVAECTALYQIFPPITSNIDSEKEYAYIVVACVKTSDTNDRFHTTIYGAQKDISSISEVESFEELLWPENRIMDCYDHFSALSFFNAYLAGNTYGAKEYTIRHRLNTTFSNYFLPLAGKVFLQCVTEFSSYYARQCIILPKDNTEVIIGPTPRRYYKVQRQANILGNLPSIRHIDYGRFELIQTEGTIFKRPYHFTCTYKSPRNTLLIVEGTDDYLQLKASVVLLHGINRIMLAHRVLWCSNGLKLVVEPTLALFGITPIWEY